MTLEDFKNKYQKAEVELFPHRVEPLPVVSVCVQTYQQAPYIKKCLDGILMQQTSFPVEILLGEDGSSDGTREICKQYAEKYSDKIRLFLHTRENNIHINNKPSGRFNFLHNLLSVKGRYFAICEGDDYWTDPLKLQKQFDFLEKNSDYTGAYTNFDKCDIQGNIIEQGVLDNSQPPYFDAINVLGHHSSQTLTVFYKYIPSVISDLTSDVFMKSINADRVISVLMAQQGKIKFMDFNSGVYRWGSGLHSSAITDNKIFERLELYKGFKEYFVANDKLIAEINAIMNGYYSRAIVRYFLRMKMDKVFSLNKQRVSETGIKHVNWPGVFAQYFSNALKSKIKK